MTAFGGGADPQKCQKLGFGMCHFREPQHHGPFAPGPRRVGPGRPRSRARRAGGAAGRSARLFDKVNSSPLTRALGADDMSDDKPAKFKPLSTTEIETFENVITNFKGQLSDLESAVGAYIVARRFGWKVLYLGHDKRTIRRYEKVLGFRIRDTVPPLGDQGERSLAWRLACDLSNFWKAVSGEMKATFRGKKRPARDQMILAK